MKYFCYMLSKKLISGLLAFLLLVSNSGFAFSVHFCGGKLASITSSFTTEEVCDMPAVEKKSCCAAPSDNDKPCCENKTVDLKKSADVIVKVFSFELSSPFLPVFSQPTFEILPIQIASEQEDFYFFDNHSPPLFKLYSQYIFYA